MGRKGLGGRGKGRGIGRVGKGGVAGGFTGMARGKKGKGKAW